MQPDNDTATQRLNDIWREWMLDHGQDVKKAQKSALEGLTELLTDGDAGLVRGVQALLADPETPGVGKRPLFQPLWEALDDAWDGAGSGRDDVLQLQAMLLAAWPHGHDPAGKIVELTASPWEVMTGRERQTMAVQRWRQKVAELQGRDEEREQLRAQVFPTKQSSASVAAFSALANVVNANLPQIQQHASQANYAHVGNAIAQIFTHLGPVCGEHIPTFFQQLDSALQASLTEELYQARNERKLLWWGQARYCHTLRTPFRRVLDPQEQLWWAAWEAADRAAGVPVEPAAAYLQEMLHALGVRLEETQSLREWIEQQHAFLHSAADAISPAGDALSRLVQEDALGFPVTWVRLHAGESMPNLNAVREAIALPLDAPVTHGQWAAWVFREILLDRFLAKEA